ncbi:MAG: HTTM domain-containing protein [Gammaproteobacteria bacterium]|nr:HTTM domain-containing protein [Gammaproteobacteria bacterium]
MPLQNVVLDRLKTIFSIDLRALAAFRVALGIMILADLALRATNLRDFYTDQGIMPRALWGKANHSLNWSFHAASGETWFQIVLFVLAAIAAFALIAGYRTRLASVVSWLLLASLINRNHFILQAGDHLLVILAFWSIFLPLGARFSVDSALRSEHDSGPVTRPAGPADHQYFSVATIAVLLQVLYLYFFTALLKTGSLWRESFDAAFYAVSLEHFATPIGIFFRDFPSLLKFATAGVLYLEFVVLFTALSPWFHTQLRLLSVVALYALHASFLLLLHIGLFPLIDFTALILLIPAPVWNWLQRRRELRQAQNDTDKVSLYYDEDCGFCRKMCLILREFCLSPRCRIEPAQQHPAIGEVLERERSWVITDGAGKQYLHSSALRFITSHALLTKPLSWLLKTGWGTTVADRVYRRIDTARPALSSLTGRFLPYRPLCLTPTVIGSVAAAVMLVAITALNITGLRTVDLKTPESVRAITRATRTTQYWGMFAPYPVKYSSYPVVPGELRDGTRVELFANIEGEPDWDVPRYSYPHFPSYRWRKMHERISGGTPHTASAYGNWLCRKWNGRNTPRDKQLATFEVYSVRRFTNTTGEPKREERKLIRRQWCFKEFAPENKA